MYWYGNVDGLSLRITKQEAESGSHVGDCYTDIKELAKFPHIKKQLNKIDPDTLIRELREYGAWDLDDLQGEHDMNLYRILWIACCDIKENNNTR